MQTETHTDMVVSSSFAAKPADVTLVMFPEGLRIDPTPCLSPCKDRLKLRIGPVQDGLMGSKLNIILLSFGSN